MDLSKIAAGRNPPKDVNALIEIPVGGIPVKYEMAKSSPTLFVDRFLHTAMYYPGNCGFIPHTLCENGDPCDIMVIAPVLVGPWRRHPLSSGGRAGDEGPGQPRRKNSHRSCR